jgi:hypothetical protein
MMNDVSTAECMFTFDRKLAGRIKQSYKRVDPDAGHHRVD